MDEGADDDASPPASPSALDEFADVIPLHVDEGEPVVAIQYDEEHAQALGLFRRIMSLGEYSQRALRLTAVMISLNQADYTAWEWRWRCLKALQVDLHLEYEFTDSIMQDNAKNYQLWNHRRKCALALGPDAAARELRVAAEALEVDSKNYHAWAHRQAIVKEYGGSLWAEELAYSEEHIREDLRNNSAWNQRAFVLRHEITNPQQQPPRPQQPLQQPGTSASSDWDPAGSVAGAEAAGAGPVAAGSDAPGAQPGEGPSRPASWITIPLLRLVERELDYMAVQVARAPRNESVWNYLRGLFTLPGMPPHAMAMFHEVTVICQEALLDAPSSPCALDMFASYYGHLAGLALQRLKTARLSAQDPVTCPTCVAARQDIEAAVGCCLVVLESLTIADPIRVMYWRHRQSGVQSVLTAATLEPSDAA